MFTVRQTYPLTNQLWPESPDGEGSGRAGVAHLQQEGREPSTEGGKGKAEVWTWENAAVFYHPEPLT